MKKQFLSFTLLLALSTWIAQAATVRGTVSDTAGFTFIKLLIEKIRYTFCLLDLIVTRYGEVDKAAFVQIRI